MADSTVTDNTASAGGGIFVATGGTFNLTGSNISTSPDDTSGGGVASDGHFSIGNSTFRQFGGDTGGAIYNNKTANTSTVINSTIVGNTAANGGNLANAAGTLNLQNTIVANSSAGGNCHGTITAGSDVLTWPAADVTCGVSTYVANPLLGTLQNNGGPTSTMLPSAGSAAIDAGNTATCVAAPISNLDQRGIARPQGSACDIGAVEVVQHALTVTVTTANGSVSATSPTPASGSITACTNAGTCAADFLGEAPAQVVTLTASPDSGYHFTAWGGGCASAGTVTMDADKTCTAAFAPNTISGTIAGLLKFAGGLSLHLDYGTGTEDLGVPNGSVYGSVAFTFTSAVPAGATYTVSVGTPPSNPSQTCTLTHASGLMPAGDIGNVSADCTTNTYTVGGNVSGLSGSGLKLLLNGTWEMAFGNGSFSFGTEPLQSGGGYNVSVSQQPSGQICTAANASGTITNANITNVAISCATASLQLTLTIDDSRLYARYGQVADYVVTLNNSGSIAATAVSVSDSASAGLDLANALWCQGATACTPTTQGPISGTVDVPAHGALTWLITIPVFANAAGPTVTMSFSAAGVGANDTDTLVIFHGSFDDANGGGVASLIPNGAANEVFTLPEPNGNAIADVYKSQSGNLRVQSVTLAGQTLVRLLAREGAQEHASAWVRAQAGATLGSAACGGAAAVCCSKARAIADTRLGSNPVR